MTEEKVQLRLRWWRKRYPMTQVELARRAGVSTITIMRIEAGEYEPLPSTIRKLAQALGVDPSDLIVS